MTVLTRSSSYDPKAKSFFSWLGVSNFLTRDQAFGTLCSITEISPVGSMVIFDYLDIDAFAPDKVSPHMRELNEFLKKIDEPIIAGFNPSRLAKDLKTLGYRLYENLSPETSKNAIYKDTRINITHMSICILMCNH